MTRYRSLSRRKANRRVDKGLNKAQAATIKDTVEFLEDATNANDTPKRLKSGMLHHSASLKQMLESKKEEPVQEMDATEQEQMLKILQAADQRLDDLDSAMYRKYGQQWRPVRAEHN